MNNDDIAAEKSSVTITYPGVTFIPAPTPNVCPGCGRCRHCGQPATVPQPYVPAPFESVLPWTNPIWYTTPTVLG